MTAHNLPRGAIPRVDSKLFLNAYDLAVFAQIATLHSDLSHCNFDPVLFQTIHPHVACRS